MEVAIKAGIQGLYSQSKEEISFTHMYHISAPF